jgi:peptidoglycan/xylan/chitin deacetylase (PgdA/CDA1 family)
MSFDSFFGNAVRFIPEEKRKVYLTFDDGPSPNGTEQILTLLEKHHVKATFFVIAQKARQSKDLIREIQKRSHGIGNHSLDHTYRPFFQGKKTLTHWIRESEELLSQQIGTPSVGFRSPAGVRTPELKWALKELQLPLILWNTRFYDTVFPWRRNRALHSLKHEKNGSIILLHDHQKNSFISLFLETLNDYIEYGKENGIEFGVLTREACAQAQGLQIKL